MGIIQSNHEFDNMTFHDINTDNVIPDEFKLNILKEFVLPYYKSNIEYVINEKTVWSRVGTSFLTTSTLLIGTASILSFASSSYPDKNLNFVAGSVGMAALVLKEFASYANSVDHIKTLTINDLLRNIGLKHTLNDSSKNFKKVIQDNKLMSSPSPINQVNTTNHNDLDNKLNLFLTNLTSKLNNVLINNNNNNNDNDKPNLNTEEDDIENNNNEKNKTNDTNDTNDIFMNDIYRNNSEIDESKINMYDSDTE